MSLDNVKRGQKIKAGQLVTGLISLSNATGISIQSIRTSLSKLKSTRELTIKPTNKFSLITIVNWDKFQNTNNQTNNQTNKQLTNNQQTTNNKQECKNEKNEKRERTRSLKKSNKNYS